MNTQNSDSDWEQEITYVVVVNSQEQYSIWRQYKEPPMGWRRTGFSGPQNKCLAYIAEIWTDMRPLNLRSLMNAEKKSS